MAQQKAETKQSAEQQQSVDKLYMENTLLRVFGALFCHDAKRARARTSTIEISKGVRERRLKIRLDPEYGQPGPFAHKIAVAVIKKQSDYGRPVRREVSFSERELMRLAGRKSWGGRDSEELALALTQIRYTHVIAYFQIKNRYLERDFSIFNEVLIERRSSHRDPIRACTLTLAEPIIRALEDEHFTCLNHFLMLRLGTIGQALYMRLFFHFANLYDGRRRERLGFTKRYDDICNEWLGGLAVAQHKSKIEERLGPHLAQLVAVGFLTSYNIHKAQTPAGQTGFVLAFRPGQAFFADYDRFYRHRHQGELQWEFRADQRDIAEPLQAAYLFAAKLTRVPVERITFASSADVSAAREFLAEIPFEQMEAFVTFGLEQAAATKFDVKTFGGLRQYVTAFKGARERQMLARHREEAKAAEEQAEAEKRAYDRYRASEGARIFTGLPPEAQEHIREAAAAKVAGVPLRIRNSMIAAVYSMDHGR